jgi:alpha-glucosidase (family GH31 glycosyl hydrolase)
MIGDRLMVAPLFAGEAERKVVMPAGEWQDFWTGELITQRELNVPSTMHEIPVFVKAGSLVPWAEVAQHTERPEVRHINVRVYGDGGRGWSAPASVGGLHLRWDPIARRGAVTQSSGKGRAFDVVGWRNIG